MSWATSRRRSTRAPRWPSAAASPRHLGQGWYVEPTLLTNVSNDSTIAQEEIFGPVIVLIPYEDEDDAVRLANDSKFGLSGSVFTSDPVKGFEIARRIRTGTFRVNTMSADFNSSFGGYKESGIGREHGPYAIDEYLLDKTISIEPGRRSPTRSSSRSRSSRRTSEPRTARRISDAGPQHASTARSQRGGRRSADRYGGAAGRRAVEADLLIEDVSIHGMRAGH